MPEGENTGDRGPHREEIDIARDAVETMLFAQNAYDELRELGLELQHVAVLGSVMHLGLRRFVAGHVKSVELPRRIPDYAFQPVGAMRLSQEISIPHATLRRRLEELVEAGLLEKTERGFVPRLGPSSRLAEKLQIAWQSVLGKPGVRG